MPLFVGFGVSAPSEVKHPGFFWKIVREVKALWRPIFESTNEGVGYPMGYMFRLENCPYCSEHLTLLIYLTVFEFRGPFLKDCARKVKGYFRRLFHGGNYPPGIWFRLYRNNWCADGQRVARFVVSSDALLSMDPECLFTTGLRYSDCAYEDEVLYERTMTPCVYVAPPKLSKSERKRLKGKRPKFVSRGVGPEFRRHSI